MMIICPIGIGYAEGSKNNKSHDEGDTIDDVEVFFYADHNETPTHVSFIGEWNLYMALQFNVNCSRYNFTIHNAPYFPHFVLNGGDDEGCRAGHGHHFGQGLNESVDPGKYDTSISINYTLDNGTEKNQIIEYPYEIIYAIKIVDVRIPDGFKRELAITIHTYVHFTSLWLQWDSDGDISVDKGENTYHDVEPGYHTFSTKISQGRAIPGDRQEVGYHLMAYNGTRCVEISEKNINVSVTWKGTLVSPCFLVTIVIILVSVGIMLARSRSKIFQ